MFVVYIIIHQPRASCFPCYFCWYCNTALGLKSQLPPEGSVFSAEPVMNQWLRFNIFHFFVFPETVSCCLLSPCVFFFLMNYLNVKSGNLLKWDFFSHFSFFFWEFTVWTFFFFFTRKCVSLIKSTDLSLTPGDNLLNFDLCSNLTIIHLKNQQL